MLTIGSGGKCVVSTHTKLAGDSEGDAFFLEGITVKRRGVFRLETFRG